MITHPQDKVGAIRNPEGIWINTEVFSEEAKHFRRYGRYSDAQPGTMAYKEYWDEQLKRRTEGYTVGGARITGAHYDYLNFCPIKRINEAEAQGVSVAKKRDFPDFWDYDYNYFHSVNIGRFGITQEELDKLQLEVTPKCLKGGHHMIIAKTRRRGFSYKGACLANNAYDTVRSALILLTAFEKTYLSPKGVLAMFNSQMSHIDAHTAFAKRREFNNTAYHKRASYRKIINGTPTEAGFLSEMMGLSFKDNPDASRGGDAYLVLMDEAGEWPGLEQAYKVLQPLCEDGMYVTGQICVFGTGGSMQSGSIDFAKMFYDPEPYNFLAFENIWDDEGEGDKVGYYVPDFKNKVGFIDSQGNSDIVGARAYEEEKRNILLASGKKEAYNQHIQEYSFMPAESFLITGDNRFPIKNLRRAKQRLEKSGMYKGVPFTFKVDGDAVGYSPDLSNALTPLYKYAGIIKDNKGAPVMFSAPKPGQTYKIGYDTIHQEQGESLAGIQVYLDSPLTANHNRVEACFYGRSTGPDGCDEIAYNFSRLYNMAEVMHENMFLTTKNNFKRWKAEDLLASQPDLLIKNIIKDSKVERQYGVHMTDKIKLEACLIGARILEAVIGFEEDGTPIMYLDTIRDLRLLEELIRFNFTGNFDAVMAFLMRCIHDEEQTLQKIASNPNTKGIGTELEELRNFRNVKGY